MHISARTPQRGHENMAHHLHPGHTSRNESLSNRNATAQSFEAARALVSYPETGDRTGRILLNRGDFQICLANQTTWRRQSEALVVRMYSRRGYKCGMQRDCLPDTGPLTLQACSNERVFGTLNIGFDSRGELACEGLYASEIRAFRDRGAVAAEFTRLAVEAEYGSKELLGALFHVAYLVAARVGRATDMFIEVNPRHVPFYKRMLNFLPAGPRRMCDRVEAPAVLLHCAVPYMREQAERCGGQRGTDSRTLYPYYGSREEEALVLDRLAALGLLDEAAESDEMEAGAFLVDGRTPALHTAA
jgi:hypothetical protein